MSWLDDIIAKVVRVNGVESVGRRALNLVAGTGVTLTATDDELNGQTTVRVDTTGGGGGSGSTVAEVLLAPRAPYMTGWELDASDGCYRQSSTAAGTWIAFPLSVRVGTSLTAALVRMQRAEDAATAPIVFASATLERRTLADGAGVPPTSWETVWSTTSYGNDVPTVLPQRFSFSLSSASTAAHVVESGYEYRIRVFGESGTSARVVKLREFSVGVVG